LQTSKLEDVTGSIPASRIAGYQWGRGGGETTLSERLLCGHMGAFHSSGVVPSEGDRFEDRMQDGTITTESSHGRMGSVSRTPAGCHSGLGSGVHTLQSRSIYSYSRVAVMDISPDSFVLMFWDFYLPPIYECMVSHGCSRLEERGLSTSLIRLQSLRCDERNFLHRP
jgi:hypothetical protein